MSDTRDSDEIRVRYKWLRERIKAEVPDIELFDDVFDFGYTYAVGVSRGEGEKRRHHAVRVEYVYATGNNPDGYQGKSWEHYSLNADPAKEERVAEIIRSFRAL